MRDTKPRRRKSDKWQVRILPYISLAIGFLSVVYIAIEKFPDIYDRVTSTSTKITEKNDKVNTLTANMLTSIQYSISQLLLDLGADRVYVAELHNGSIVASGRSFEKFSYTFEETSPVIAKDSDKMQSIPITFVNFALPNLFSSNKNYIYDWKLGECGDEQANRWFDRTKVRNTKIISIVTPTGQIIGFLGVEYILNEHEFNQNDSIAIKECIASIKHSLIQLKDLKIIP